MSSPNAASPVSTDSSHSDFLQRFRQSGIQSFLESLSGVSKRQKRTCAHWVVRYLTFLNEEIGANARPTLARARQYVERLSDIGTGHRERRRVARALTVYHRRVLRQDAPRPHHVDFLTDVEQGRVLDRLVDRSRLLARLVFETAGSPYALAQMRVEDVHLAAGVVTVRDEAGRALRTASISHGTARRLDTYLRRRRRTFDRTEAASTAHGPTTDATTSGAAWTQHRVFDRFRPDAPTAPDAVRPGTVADLIRAQFDA